MQKSELAKCLQQLALSFEGFEHWRRDTTPDTKFKMEMDLCRRAANLIAQGVEGGHFRAWPELAALVKFHCGDGPVPLGLGPPNYARSSHNLIADVQSLLMAARPESFAGKVSDDKLVTACALRILAEEEPASDEGKKTPNGGASGKTKRRSLGQVQADVERIVKARGGKWPGYNAIVGKGFTRGTVQNAVKQSAYLNARVAESKTGGGKKPKAVTLSAKVEASHGKKDAELQALINEQKHDQKTDGGKTRIHKRV